MKGDGRTEEESPVGGSWERGEPTGEARLQEQSAHGTKTTELKRRHWGDQLVSICSPRTQRQTF